MSTETDICPYPWCWCYDDPDVVPTSRVMRWRPGAPTLRFPLEVDAS